MKIKISKVNALLRIYPYWTCSFFEKHPELGVQVQDEIKELSDIQYFHLFKDVLTCYNDRLSYSWYGYYNDKYANYKPKDIHITIQKHSIEFGLLVRCNMEETFGIVIGANTHKCYYFKKRSNCIIPKYDIVSFTIDEKDINKAKNVLSLSKYEVVEGGGDFFIDNDNHFIYKREWNYMQKMIPFLRDRKIYFPILEKKQILYYTCELNNDSLDIYNNYCILRAFNYLPKDIHQIDICSEIKRLKKYIRQFDAKKVIESYVIEKKKYLQVRPGRDDHNISVTKRTIDTWDPYMLSLLKVGEDVWYYCSNGDDDYHYSYIDYKEMQEKKSNAYKKYSKDEHLAFFIEDMMNVFVELRLQRERAYAKKISLFNFYHDSDYNSFQRSTLEHYASNENYKEIVQDVNNNIC